MQCMFEGDLIMCDRGRSQKINLLKNSVSPIRRVCLDFWNQLKYNVTVAVDQEWLMSRMIGMITVYHWPADVVVCCEGCWIRDSCG